jgi:hypothetical protein
MTFSLIRYEICHLSRRLSYTPPGEGPCQNAALSVTLEDKERLIKECADRLEERYLQYCEDAGPLYWVAATVARLITAKMSLIIYHPLISPGKPNSLSQDIKDRLFMASIEILEYSKVLKGETSTKKWGWLFHTYIQWHAIAYILGQLACRPSSVIVERAWRAMDSLFADWGAAGFKNKTGMLWNPMKRLAAKARCKREENMASNQGIQELGMDSKNIRPQPTGPKRGGGCEVFNPGWSSSIARDRVLAQTTSNTNSSSYQPTDIQTQSRVESMDLPFTTSPISTEQGQFQLQNVGMNGFLPDQTPVQQLQQQQQPWLGDDSALLDLDMQGIDGDINWEGWDDRVRDFQMETDISLGANGRGPMMGSMGTWW